jgi:prepilin-type N-terminal cleavage/methylation domain-containing protein
MSRSDGFTLIELVLVILIISGGMLGLTLAFSNSAKSLFINETVQQAAQYAQECAESAIATRRNAGFDWFANNTFLCATNANGINLIATVGALYTGTILTACPNGIQCRDITITATSSSNAQLSSSINLMLVRY